MPVATVRGVVGTTPVRPKSADAPNEPANNPEEPAPTSY